MDANEAVRVVERLREIRRRCKRLQITVGNQVVRVELDSRCEVRVSSDGPVTVELLDKDGFPAKTIS